MDTCDTITLSAHHQYEILSTCSLRGQTRVMEVLRRRTGRKQRDGRQAEREGVRWRDFLLRGSVTLIVEPQPATRIAHSDSAPLPVWLSLLSLSLPHSVGSLCSLAASPAFCQWQSKSTAAAAAAASLPQLSPSYLTSALFPRQAGLKSQLRIEPSRLKPVSK